jgi:hypothetical protein
MRWGLPTIERLLPIALLSAIGLGAEVAHGAGRAEVLVDRVVARFSAPEAGGVEKPHYVLGRELAFEARLLALAGGARVEQGFDARQAEAALERHIAETLIADLAIDPEPTPAEFRTQARVALGLAEGDVGGAEALLAASRAEGLSRLEVQQVFRRRARASLYLDRMVAPMLSPTRLELRRVHERETTPFSGLPWEQAEVPLRNWLVQTRLRKAILDYYQNARTRLKIEYFR